MREIKFDVKNNSYEGDDIHSAFRENSLGERLKDIDVIVAEVCGENDDVDWYWILKMKDGTFSWAKGGCDYTGWDCQSSAEIHDGFKTPQEAIAEVTQEYDIRRIKECLSGQIEEKIPFAIYQ